jgi:hypothetical protein
MVTHLHRHMNQQHFTVPLKQRVVAGPADQLTRLSDIGVVLGSHIAVPVTLSKQDHERAMDAAFSVLQADDDIDKAIPVLGLGALAAGAGRLAMRAIGRKAAGVGAGTLAGSKATKPLYMREGANQGNNSVFDRLKEGNEKREQMAQQEKMEQQQRSQNLRSSANPASTNTTQFS